MITLIQEALNHETQQLNNELVDCISVIQKPMANQTTGKTVLLENQYYSEMGEVTRNFVLPYERCGKT